MSTLHYHGHSTFTVKTGPHTLLIDPFFTENPKADVAAETITPTKILVTHGHFDHVGHVSSNEDRCQTDLEDIARRADCQVICGFEIAQWLGKLGIPAHGMGPGGSHKFDFGTVLMTPAVHSSMLPDGSDGGVAAGYILRLEDATIYFAGDTALFSDMSLIGEEEPDVAVLPIGDNYTMGPFDAARAAGLIKAPKVVPCHYETWPLLEVDVDAFTKQCGVFGHEPVLMTPGQAIEVGRG